MAFNMMENVTDGRLGEGEAEGEAEAIKRIPSNTEM